MYNNSRDLMVLDYGVESSRKYICGYCKNNVASKTGWVYKRGKLNPIIYICPHCDCPTYFEGTSQTPGVSYGNDVDGIEDEATNLLYYEARDCCSTESYTASVLCSRKLLMNIAVSKGADEGLSFNKYVEYLSDNHFIPPGSEEWVHHIRKKGNEATHEIDIMEKDDAIELIMFIEMLLKFIYELPAKMKVKDS